MTQRRKRGRPRISRDGELLKPRTVRFSDAEWAWVKAMASARGMTPTRWLRIRGLKGFRPNKAR